MLASGPEVWKKQANGTRNAVADIWNSDLPAPAPPEKKWPVRSLGPLSVEARQPACGLPIEKFVIRGGVLSPG